MNVLVELTDRAGRVWGRAEVDAESQKEAEEIARGRARTEAREALTVAGVSNPTQSALVLKARVNVLWTLCMIYTPGSEPESKFSFHAKDEQEARSKAFVWCRYHSFDRSDVRVRHATPDEKNNIHNEWIPTT